MGSNFDRIIVIFLAERLAQQKAIIVSRKSKFRFSTDYQVNFRNQTRSIKY